MNTMVTELQHSKLPIIPHDVLSKAIHDLRNIVQIFSCNLDLITGKDGAANPVRRMSSGAERLHTIIAELTTLRTSLRKSA